MRQHRICIVGSGYVGLVTGACLAEIGHRVVCVDSDKKKLAFLKKGKNPIYEPGLDELLTKHRRTGALKFASSIPEGLRFGKAGDAEVVFIAVGTPPRPNGSADLSYVEAVAAEVAKNIRNYTVIVDKSTVPVETGEWVKKTVEHFSRNKVPFDVASNPEFLAEGSAVKDFLHPDRVVLGVYSRRAEELLRSVYAPLKAPMLVTDVKSAELIKHASNSFLATKISFINAVSVICEKTGADVAKVAEGMGLDRRIGPQFLRAGLGFGGFCLAPDERIVIRDAAGSVRTLTVEAAHREFDGKQAWEALSLDPKTNRMTFRLIAGVSRRPYDGLLVRVKTKMGRSVAVTADHPLLARRGSEWAVVSAGEITDSDWLPLFTRMPAAKSGVRFDLIDALKAHRPDFFDHVLVRPAGTRWDLSREARRALLKITGGNSGRAHDVAVRGTPLRLGEYLALEETGLLALRREDIELGTAKGLATYVPAIVAISPDFCRFLGYLQTEGCLTEEIGVRGIRERLSIHFHQDEREYLDDVRTVLTGLGIRFMDVHVPQHKVRRVVISSRVFAFFIRDILGCVTDSYSARVPEVVLSSDDESRFAFLIGSIRGDGSMSFPRHSPAVTCEFGTVSTEMAEGLTLLAQSIGLVASRKSAMQNKSTLPAHFLRFSGAAQVRVLAGAKDSATARRVQSRLAELKRNPAPAGFAIISPEVAAVRVTSTERRRHSGFVYSLEVEGTETFATGSGLIVHNCFPKDLEAFYWIAHKKGYDFKLLQAVKEINEHQKEWPIRAVETELWNLEGKNVAVLGLSFKPNTDDLRFAPSLEIIEKLHAHNVKVTVFDPVAMEKAKPLLKRVRFAKSAYDAVKGADCLILITEWAEFRDLDFDKVKRLMRHPIVLDGRNFFDPAKLRALGFTYKGVGRP